MRARKLLVVAVAAVACTFVAPAAASAVGLAQVGSYTDPVYVTSDPTDPDRLFVVERAGRIQLTTPAGTTEFLDITGPVQDSYVEQGLLSMAFAPDFAASGLIYLYYTGTDSGTIHVAEVHTSGNGADLATLRDVITIPHGDAPNHNGGQLQFGPDGYLYIGTGDGGGANDSTGAGNNAQNLAGRLGKLLRIDPRRSGAQSYTVPADNPFAGAGAVAPEIWSYGLRNPYRFSFDRATGDLVIGDVGQGIYEEVDFAASPGGGRGVNYGWRCREGAHPNPNSSVPACTPPGAVDPVLEYTHSGGACAITGGYVVRDPGLGELEGRYVYADYCTGQVRSAALATPAASGDRSEGLTVPQISSFGEDACGRVYAASLAGAVFRLVDGTPTGCGSPQPDPAVPCSRVLEGTGGRDRLRGGAGGDRMLGKGGDDRLTGGAGDDCLVAGRGEDEVAGGRGKDLMRGGPGADVLRAAGDGERDRVICGSGRDVATVDRHDRARGCERIRELDPK